MAELFQWLAPAALGLVLAVLGAGIFAMMRGGEFNRRWGNRLMRARVAMQVLAVLIIMGAVYFAGD